MKVQDIKTLDLNNTYFSIGKTSVTVKVEGKTKNVITGIKTWASMQFNHQVDWNIKFHKMGLKGNSGVVPNLIFDNNNLYYIFDIDKYSETLADIEKYGGQPELYNIDYLIERKNKIESALELCEKNNIEVLKLKLLN